MILCCMYNNVYYIISYDLRLRNMRCLNIILLLREQFDVAQIIDNTSSAVDFVIRVDFEKKKSVHVISVSLSFSRIQDFNLYPHISR